MTSAVDPPAEPGHAHAAGQASPVQASPVQAVPPGWPADGVPPGWPADGVAPGSPSGWPADGRPQYVAAQPDRLTRFMTRLWVGSPRWLAPVASLGCMAGAVGYTMVTDPTASAAEAVPTCVLKLTTGLDCPGCGGTRAFWYVLHGDLPAAARHHILFVFALPFLLYLYLAWAGQQLFRWRLPQLRVTPTMIGVFLAAWLVFTVARNLPWAPFTWFYV